VAMWMIFHIIKITPLQKPFRVKIVMVIQPSYRLMYNVTCILCLVYFFKFSKDYAVDIIMQSVPTFQFLIPPCSLWLHTSPVNIAMLSVSPHFSFCWHIVSPNIITILSASRNFRFWTNWPILCESCNENSEIVLHPDILFFSFL